MSITVAAVLERHGLSQNQAARLSGIPLPTLNDIVARRREPRRDTINRLLAFLRTLEPSITYEDVFGERAA